ncbi:hypothetical protein M434DRAFT_31512 [Hypoxylon sp. CO27-5]|nr:hypothetical protein M434DRAFT_31512 [Hypoxylon sp. CO27-5]
MSSDNLLETRDALDIFEPRGIVSESSTEALGYNELQSKHPKRKWSRLYALNVALLILNGFLAIMFTKDAPLCEDQHFLHTHSPAGEIIQYELRYFEKYGHLSSPFAQKPGPELDAAWHDQLSGMNIRVSKQWLELFDVESVHLADGSGVLAQLGVYHELHCLKKLKHWIYRSYYYGNATIDLEEEEAHIEHCLEWLRVAAICRGDTTLTTFQWGGPDGSNLETEYPIPRQCVNSEKLLRWSEERSVDITQDGLLEKKPTKGT